MRNESQEHGGGRAHKTDRIKEMKTVKLIKEHMSKALNGSRIFKKQEDFRICGGKF